MCSQTDDPSQNDGFQHAYVHPGPQDCQTYQECHGRAYGHSATVWPTCEHGLPDYGALTCAEKGHLGCDNAPSSMTGHSGQCGSLDEHYALLKAGFGIGPRYDESTADLIAGDRELIADEFHGRYPR